MNRYKTSDGQVPVRRGYLRLLVIPFLWQVAMVPVVNDIAWSPLHIPFPMLWQMLGVVVTSVIIAIVFHCDKRAGMEREEAEFLANTTAGTGGGH